MASVGGSVSGRRDDADGRLHEVYGAYWGPLVGWLAIRTGGDRGLAEDLAQDTFVRFAEADGFDGSRPAWPYLRAVASNVLIDHLRRAERQVVADVADVDEWSVPCDGPDDVVAARELVGSVLGRLSDRQRMAVELQYGRGWSVEESAVFLGCRR